ncbi:hypothetical protein PsorP6_007095 [Peronosclerospora sorghi]|uniref:Uncharacterized protein n=1 Tax=Peronosclerospora sorghi TaxID=230839 RepID=A0ACC0WC27_9STRA|nr:hypothetical protein PsorP6_007095 [Peronosclerospora sorghi]
MPSVAEPYLETLANVRKTKKTDDRIENVFQAAFKNPHREAWAFKMLKLYGYTPEDVLKVAVGNKAFLEFHAKYLNWLQLHHPTPGFGSTLTPRQFLFERSRVERAIKDRGFAFRLFEKWDSAGIEKDEAFKQVKNIGLSKDATAQLRKHYSIWKPERRKKSWLRRLLERFLSFLFKRRSRSA